MNSRPKKILFIANRLDSGGVAKSLTSLLNVIDKENYDISLFLLSSKGYFKSLLPSGITLIENPATDALLSTLKGFSYLIRHNPFMAFAHLVRLGLSMVSKNCAARLLAKLLPSVKEEFDLIVDYGGQAQLYYMVDRLEAPVKVTFFHSDYSKWPYYYKSDRKYFKKVDKIFTVSPHCEKVLKEWFPDQCHKIGIMENISSLNFIEKLSEEKIEDIKEGIPSILTVGHVSENKGTDLALQAARMLKEKGVVFHWYFLGSNENSEFYDSQVKALGLNGFITFLGLRVNPYPYIKNATLIVHPSKFEGRSIALDEAKLLLKPVVVTNFTTVHDQFIHGYNASITEMNPQEVADAINRLLLDACLRQKYYDNLLKDRKDNSGEVNKLYNLLQE